MQAARHSAFRPCIDLHDGQVKQIIGGTLSDAAPESLKTNFIARLVKSQFNFAIDDDKLPSQPPAYFASLYRENGLVGGHVIKLGPGNDGAAKEALQTWPGMLRRFNWV